MKVTVSETVMLEYVGLSLGFVEIKPIDADGVEGITEEDNHTLELGGGSVSVVDVSANVVLGRAEESITESVEVPLTLCWIRM